MFCHAHGCVIGVSIEGRIRWPIWGRNIKISNVLAWTIIQGSAGSPTLLEHSFRFALFKIWLTLVSQAYSISRNLRAFIDSSGVFPIRMR